MNDAGTPDVARPTAELGGRDVAHALYTAFAAGDVPAVLAMFDERIEWRQAEGHPYRPDGSPWIGPEAVVTELFARLGKDFAPLAVTPHRITGTADGALVEGRYTGAVTATGRPLDAQFCHVLRIREGRVTHFQQYLDTASLQWAMGHTVAR